MIGIEALEEQDLRHVAAFYGKLGERAKTAGPKKEMHSIDDDGMPAGGTAGQLARTRALTAASVLVRRSGGAPNNTLVGRGSVRYSRPSNAELTSAAVRSQE